MKCKGFTMIELLVVIAILGLLLTLFSPGLIGIKYFAYRVQCGKSMEQLGKGWISYYAENNFNLVSAYTQDNGQCWVLQGNTIESMELGQLWFAWRAGLLGQKLASYAYFLQHANRRRLGRRRRTAQARRTVSDRQFMGGFSGAIDVPGLNHGLMRLVANPLLKLYWAVARRLIF